VSVDIHCFIDGLRLSCQNKIEYSFVLLITHLHSVSGYSAK